MPGLQLSKDRGINPRLTVCCRCGGESPELLLIGTADWLHECTVCGVTHIGTARERRCKVDGCGGNLTRIRRLDEHERLPSTEPCDACQAEIAEHRAAVEAGGVYFKCSDCGHQGVIKASSPFAAEVRKAHGIDPPGACGVEFDKDDCPACGPQPVEAPA